MRLGGQAGKKLAVSRRALLKTFAGLSAGAATQFRGLLRDTFVHAADAAPLRFIALTYPHGRTSLWRPRAPGGGAAAETGWTLDFDPDSCLGPLEKHKSSLVVLDGLDFYCVYRKGASGLTGHTGAIAALTGRDLRSNADRRPQGGPSLDIHLASLLKVKPVVFNFSISPAMASWDAGGAEVPGYQSMSGAYKDLFGSLVPPKTGPTEDPAVAARRKAEMSVLSTLAGEAAKLRGRLAGPERLKIDSYLESLRLMESDLTKPPPPAAGCTKPAAPAQADYLLDGPTSQKLALDMIGSALACNLTRVATFHMDGGGTMPFLNLPGNPEIHDGVIHQTRPDDDASVRKSSKVIRWYAQQVSYLIDLLKAVPEAGGTVYDHTIILLTSELADGAPHSSSDVPFVLAGGGGTYKKGRLIDVGGAGSETNPHNPLLCSIANQFGSNLAGFGDPMFPGELAGL